MQPPDPALRIGSKPDAEDLKRRHRADGAGSLTKTIGNRSGQKNADESTTLTGLEEGTLPSGWDGITALDGDAVLPLKSFKCDEVS